MGSIKDFCDGLGPCFLQCFLMDLKEGFCDAFCLVS
jgi:hypothetical protein